MSEKERQKKDGRRKETKSGEQPKANSRSKSEQVQRNPGRSRTGSERNTPEQGTGRNRRAE